jgi:hypothetical protein
MRSQGGPWDRERGSRLNDQMRNTMTIRLTPLKLLMARRLLEAQWRFVQIAKELEISVWTVSRIANDPDLNGDPLPDDQLPVDDAPPDYTSANLRRCTGCGGMVYHWPCIACEAMAGPKAPPAPEVVDELADRVGWDLMERGSRWGQRKRRTKGSEAYRKELARTAARS